MRLVATIKKRLPDLQGNPEDITSFYRHAHPLSLLRRTKAAVDDNLNHYLDTRPERPFLGNDIVWKVWRSKPDVM